MKELTPDKFLSEQEVNQLTTAVHEKAAADREAGRLTWPRIELMVYLALGTGLRASELINVTVDDLNLGHEPTLHVRNGKGGKDRQVLLSKPLKRRLKRWIRRKGLTGDDYILTRQYSRMALHKQLKKALKAAGLPDKYSMHSLRHTYGTQLYAAEKDLRFVQRQLGHSAPAVTQIYVDVTKESGYRQVNGLYQ